MLNHCRQTLTPVNISWLNRCNNVTCLPRVRLSLIFEILGYHKAFPGLSCIYNIKATTRLLLLPLLLLYLVVQHQKYFLHYPPSLWFLPASYIAIFLILTAASESLPNEERQTPSQKLVWSEQRPVPCMKRAKPSHAKRVTPLPRAKSAIILLYQAPCLLWCG